MPDAQANPAKIRDELTDEQVVLLAEVKIVTILCPGGKERMRRLMEMVRTKRIDLIPLPTHTYSLDAIEDAYALLATEKTAL